jgi:hypothetical protein
MEGIAWGTTAIVYPRKWRWPHGQKIAISIGLAFEAFTYRSQFNTLGGAARAGNNPSPLSLSYAEYGWKAGVWRLMETLDRYGLHANMSVSAQAAEQHPNVIAAVIKAGHEINGHGWVNDVHPHDNEEEEADIRRCTAVLTQVAGVPPVGWTGPGSAGSQHTLSILKELGYLWNGDDASDDLPFLRATDQGPMVIMPRTNIPQNDLAMWLAPRNPPASSGRDSRTRSISSIRKGKRAPRSGWKSRCTVTSADGRPCSL